MPCLIISFSKENYIIFMMGLIYEVNEVVNEASSIHSLKKESRVGGEPCLKGRENHVDDEFYECLDDLARINSNVFLMISFRIV